MTQEDKELLEKDLSARLPYDLKVRRYVYTTPVDAIESVELFSVDWLKELYVDEAEFKPYLFPMSSMTEEQAEAFDNAYTADLTVVSKNVTKRLAKQPYENNIGLYRHIDWLNAHHFDFRGLIEKGLAIDATGKNIYL